MARCGRQLVRMKLEEEEEELTISGKENAVELRKRLGETLADVVACK